jgi:hypothetical protein
MVGRYDDSSRIVLPLMVTASIGWFSSPTLIYDIDSGLLGISEI